MDIPLVDTETKKFTWKWLVVLPAVVAAKETKILFLNVDSIDEQVSESQKKLNVLKFIMNQPVHGSDCLESLEMGKIIYWCCPLLIFCYFKLPASSIFCNMRCCEE